MTRLYRIAWPLVLVTALAVSAWSLFWVARYFGVPLLLAVPVSIAFDGAAIVAAYGAQRYATSPDSGLGPRLTMVVILAASVYLNIEHAALAGYGGPARVLFAAPGITTVLLFEHERAWSSREARRDAGRIAPALPVVGRAAWVFHPVRAVAVLSRVAGQHLDALTPVASAPAVEAAPLAAVEVPGPAVEVSELVAVEAAPELPALAVEAAPVANGATLSDDTLTDGVLDAAVLMAMEPPAWSGMTKVAAVERADAALPGRTARALSVALGQVGIECDAAGVRAARARVRARNNGHVTRADA